MQALRLTNYIEPAPPDTSLSSSSSAKAHATQQDRYTAGELPLLNYVCTTTSTTSSAAFNKVLVDILILNAFILFLNENCFP